MLTTEQRREMYHEILLGFVRERREHLLSSYISATTKVTVKCVNNHIYKVTPAHYKNGKGCPACAGVSPRHSENNFKILSELNGDSILGTYTNNRTKVPMTCCKGHSFQVRPNDYKNGHGCPVCSKRCRKAAERKLVKSIKLRGDQLLSNYVTNKDKVKILCANGHVFNMAPADYKDGHGCPVCSGHNQKEAYIHIIYDNNIPVGLKFGISRLSSDRLRKQNRKSKFHIRSFGVWNFNEVRYCKFAESLVKTAVPTHHLSMADVPDGYTETTPISSLEDIIAIYELSGGVKCDN